MPFCIKKRVFRLSEGCVSTRENVGRGEVAVAVVRGVEVVAPPADLN